jgi:hypothetical protein
MRVEGRVHRSLAVLNHRAVAAQVEIETNI